jgi:hypothetical protein
VASLSHLRRGDAFSQEGSALVGSVVCVCVFIICLLPNNARVAHVWGGHG